MDDKLDSNFTQKVCELVSQIPHGRVMTYGQIAVLAGSPRAARIVGGVAHFGDPNLPWHRVVNKKGGMARGFTFGGPEAQKKLLQEEGVIFDNTDCLDIAKYLWSLHE